jgi:protein disulfide-isomerase A1
VVEFHPELHFNYVDVSLGQAMTSLRADHMF